MKKIGLFSKLFLIITAAVICLMPAFASAWSEEPDDGEMLEIVNAAHEAAIRLVDPMKAYSTYPERRLTDTWSDLPPGADKDEIAVLIYGYPAVGAFERWDELNEYLHLYFTDKNIDKLKSLLPLMKISEDGHIIAGSSHLETIGTVDRDSLQKKGSYSVISRTPEVITVHVEYDAGNGSVFETDYHFEKRGGVWQFSDFMFPGVLYDQSAAAGQANGRSGDRTGDQTGDPAVSVPDDSADRSAASAVILLLLVAGPAGFSIAKSRRKKGNKAAGMFITLAAVTLPAFLFLSCTADVGKNPARPADTPVFHAATGIPGGDVPTGSTEAPTAGEQLFSYKKIKGTDTLIITAYNGNSSSVTIPDNIDGLPVAQIGKGIFTKNVSAGSVTEIIVQGRECEIRDGAFAGCPGLKKLVVNSERKDVLHKMFESGEAENGESRDGFDRIKLPDSGGVCYIPSSLAEICFAGEELPDKAFAGITSIRTVTLSESAETVPEEAFLGCSALEKIAAGGIKTVGPRSFKGCVSLKTDPSALGPVTSIMDGAFSGCSALTAVTVPETLTEIGPLAFEDCTGVKILNYMAENAGFKGYYSPFDGMTGVEKLVIGEKVRSIPDNTFYSCYFTLSELTIPGNVKSIGSNAFRKAGSFKEIRLCEGIKEIGDNAFGTIRGLESVSVPGSLETAGSGIFRWNTALKKVDLGNGLAAIGERMFGDCSSLEEIRLPESITSIGERAFEYCISLKNVHYAGIGGAAERVTVGDRAFYICLRLDPSVAENNYASVGAAAFFGAGIRADRE